MTKAELSLMKSPGARLVSAAFNNDFDAAERLLMEERVDINSRDWDDTTPLIAAASKGHRKLLEMFLAHGANVNAIDRDNVTSLSQAAFGGHQEIVFLLLPLVDDVDSTALSRVTALWLAASEGHAEIVSTLIEHGADHANARSDGITALMVASASGHSRVVQILLEAGASAVDTDQDGLTALMSAAEQGDLDTVRMLVDAGADVNLMSESGFSALIIACAHGHLPVVQYLFASGGALLTSKHPQDITPLMYAAAGGFIEVVQYLLDQPQMSAEFVNKRHASGGSALTEAASANHKDVLQALIIAGADPLVVDNDGITGLMAAAAEGYTDICQILLDAGVPVNTAAKSGGTALMFAAGEGHVEVTALLIEKGANVNMVVEADAEYIEKVAKDIAQGKEGVEPHKNGVSALMVAALEGHFDTVRLLVEDGHAHVTAVDDDGSTALTNAAKGKHYSICLYLLEHGANPNDSFAATSFSSSSTGGDGLDFDSDSVSHTQHTGNLLMDAILMSNSELANLLIEKGAALSYMDDDGVTPLIQAAYQGMTEIVSILLMHDAELVLSVNHEGVSPLIAAASEGHTDVVKLIMDTGKADINLKDKDGTTSLMAAAVRGYKDTIVALLSYGAQVNMQNIDGHTALMFAYNGKNQVQTLLEKYNTYLSADGNDSVDEKVAHESVVIITEALLTHTEIISLLVSSGADGDIKDFEGHVAVDFDYQEVLSLSRGDEEAGEVSPTLSSDDTEL